MVWPLRPPYLFLCTGLDGAADFESGVAIAVSSNEIVGSGEVTDLAGFRKTHGRRAAIYVHLLATTLAARRAIVEDLRPEARAELRLAA